MIVIRYKRKHLLVELLRKMHLQIIDVLQTGLIPVRQDLITNVMQECEAAVVISFNTAFRHVVLDFSKNERPRESEIYRNRCGGITYKFCARVEMMSSVAD